MFDDTAGRPLDLRVLGSSARRGATLRDVSYASAGGDRVSAWLVVPDATGPHAGLLWQHWGFGSRHSFLAEALALATAGVVSLLLDAPGFGARKGTRPLFRAHEPARAYAMQAIGDLRRGLDVLCADAGVAAARLGFVGHSLGASVGGQLAGADARVRAAVLVGGTGTISRLWLPRANDADRRALAGFDAVAWVGRSRAVCFFQYAERDEFITRADAEAYVGAAPRSTRVAWYPCDHAFDRVARLERANWLRDQLDLGPLDEAALGAAELPTGDRIRYRMLKPLLALAKLRTPRPTTG